MAEINDASGACTLCGYVPEGDVAVETPHPDATDQAARQELAHEFRIDVLLGQGEHSAVYLVRAGRSSKYLVLKVMPRPLDRDPQADERFRRAAELLASLDHPHIVPAHRFGTTDSLFWYTMDHVRARSLREILRSRGRLELKMCMRVVAQIASALDYAHRRGAVHGALKPENVLIDPNGWVHICDPLVTRAIERPASGPRRASASGTPGPVQPLAPRTTPDGTRRDTPAGDAAPPPASRRPDYVAPEDQPGLPRHAASDQYALAVMVHECLAGTLPSAGAASFEPPASLDAVRPDLPPHVTHAVRRAMSPKPGDRYPSILDFVMALESGVLPLTDARPSGRASELILSIPGWTPPPSARPRWLLPAIAIPVVALGVLLVNGPIHRWRTERAWERQMATRVIQQPPRAGPDTASAVAAADSLSRAGAPDHPNLAPFAARPRSRPRGDDPAAPTAAATRPVLAPRAAAPAPTPAPSAAAETGRLFVNATPWGQVFVDGALVGNTPKANLAVAAGTHAIRVVRDGFETWERTVQVGAGEVVRLTDIVLTARP